MPESILALLPTPKEGNAKTIMTQRIYNEAWLVRNGEDRGTPYQTCCDGFRLGGITIYRAEDEPTVIHLGLPLIDTLG